MTKTMTLLLAAGLATATPALAQQASNSDEVRALVAEMINDAESRTSLLAAGDAGHDGKFFIAGDGFRLNVGGQLQFRYLLNFRDDENSDDVSNGFQTRRTKLDFNGEINRDWFFRVLLNADQEGSIGVQEAFAGYKFANGVKARWGQFKLPMLREELVSSSRQLAVERSVVNSVFTQDRGQGIELAYSTEMWRIAGAFSDGLDSDNTDFNDAGGVGGTPSLHVMGESEYALTARAEFMIQGNDWRMWDDFTSQKGQDFGFLLGAAVHWQQSTQTPAPTDVDTDTVQFTVDASLEGDSWNVFGAFVYRWQEQSALGAGDTDLSDMGFVLQGGWRFAENTEVFARWETLLADDDRFATSEDTFNFLTLGLNQYYAGHAAKATIDMVWAFEDTSNLVGSDVLSTGNGLLGDVEENEVVIRAQFQLLF